jgi:hypothetical protein
MAEYFGSERRNFKRIRKEFVLRLKDVGDSSNWDIVLVKDISAGGVQFVHERPFPIGQHLDFRISFSLNMKPIQCVGKVLRCEQAPKSGYYTIAANFTLISDKEKELINDSASKFYLKSS